MGMMGNMMGAGMGMMATAAAENKPHKGMVCILELEFCILLLWVIQHMGAHGQPGTVTMQMPGMQVSMGMPQMGMQMGCQPGSAAFSFVRCFT